jgi:hypothetical protein
VTKVTKKIKWIKYFLNIENITFGSISIKSKVLSILPLIIVIIFISFYKKFQFEIEKQTHYGLII